MAWRSSGSSNEDLIQQLRDYGVIKHDSIADVMKKTDRKLYCRVTKPYDDRPQSIGHSATISAPHMHAYALDLLKNHIKPDSRILDVGSGSGYLCACFARYLEHLSPEHTGHVVGIEHHPKLVEFSIENLNSDDPKFLANGKVKLVRGDGRQGFRDSAPYDAIHVGAAAPETPDKLLKQLNKGGRMIIPVGPAGDTQYLQQFDKNENGVIEEITLMPVVYVPLTDLKL